MCCRCVLCNVWIYWGWVVKHTPIALTKTKYARAYNTRTNTCANVNVPSEMAEMRSPSLIFPSTTCTRHTTPRVSSYHESTSRHRSGAVGSPGGGGMRSMTAWGVCVIVLRRSRGR